MSRLYLKSRSLIAPKVCGIAAHATSAVVDLSDFPEGDLVLEMHAAKATAESDHSLTAVWMEGDAAGGPFADSGLVFREVGEAEDILDSIPLDRSVRKQFGYFVGTPAGEAPEIALSVALTAYQQLAS